MNKAFEKYRKSNLAEFVLNHQKYAPILVFMGGFIFDTLTLGRIDRTYDTVVLCLHMSFLSLWIFLFNTIQDRKWNTRIKKQLLNYLPLAIQFSFGGLSSAFVIYFFRSVSLTKTMSFFILLVLLLLANEFLKKRISNTYLQFSIYFFISFTFFAFMIPMLIKEMNTFIFIVSGLLSLAFVLSLIFSIYKTRPTIKAEVNFNRLIGIILSIYFMMNTFYYFNLIPPVPLAMETGLVAHKVQKNNNQYTVSYEKDDWYVFWRQHHFEFHRQAEEAVYVFTSIFAPTALNKSVYHRWQWYDPKTQSWQVMEDIGFEIKGGRDRGFRGYTYKNNVMEGQWKVEVITEEELVIGVVDFEIKNSSVPMESNRVEQVF